MARVPAFVAGLMCGLVLGTAVIVGHADDVQAEVLAAASAAHVDPQQLQGAVNTLEAHGMPADPYTYLRSTGELPSEKTLPPSAPSSPAAPASGVLSSRIACLEAKESQGHNIANLRGSGAVGVLQYMVPTFQSHAREMGHTDWSPWVPWQAEAVAEHDLAMGRRSQWTVSGC